ncbi:snf2 domain-containing protein classy 3 [Phtheirospermum japonicum]|uniref:Snf2 domain-containing protein classy 3 n=1 Tax=Phtheirospermum japonicum TaxID=374723 RepID=A0A830BL62_9LAMI|nr:snf2 domain-containing protein classy 3 [Phtheirospermum japonicum]
MWMTGGGILGISYRLFTELAGGNNDEGHNPRNKKSRTWRALSKVKTRRRVMLSGTPFQNNCVELLNTLCLVNPRFSSQTASSSGRKRKSSNSGDFKLKKLRSMIEPFVHINKGGILEKTLPGMRDFLILLKPTDLQKKLLQKNIEPHPGKFFEQEHLASLISVHPALVSKRPEFSDHKREVKLVEFDPDAGVKTRFLVKLIQLSSRLGEKVLVFSQYIDPLEHIKSLLAKHFSWNEGREMIYLDGKCLMNERQRLMNLFNDKRSEAKVMLASQKACSEGINLVGASRVVLLDVVWNPSVQRQAICRAYRHGQEKVVHVYRLLTSAEVDKYARQAEKERISELIFSPGDKGETISVCNEGVEKDKVLEAMVGHQSLGGMFEKIVSQPKESDDFIL